MSAQDWRARTTRAYAETEVSFRRMNEMDLAAVMAIENVIYTHPWTCGNFVDSLRAGNHCWIMERAGVVVGYAVLMAGAGEAHLLNLSVGSAWQRRGIGREFLSYLFVFIKEIKAKTLFLEVRMSNTAARALYTQAGFHEIATRRGYYPAHAGREDAIVLEYKL